MSVILPAEVQLPSPGVEYTPHSPEQTDQLIDLLTQSFYRHVSRCVLLLVQIVGNRSVIRSEERN